MINFNCRYSIKISIIWLLVLTHLCPSHGLSSNEAIKEKQPILSAQKLENVFINETICKSLINGLGKVISHRFLSLNQIGRNQCSQLLQCLAMNGKKVIADNHNNEQSESELIIKKIKKIFGFKDLSQLKTIKTDDVIFAGAPDVYPGFFGLPLPYYSANYSPHFYHLFPGAEQIWDEKLFHCIYTVLPEDVKFLLIQTILEYASAMTLNTD